jgi:hypothetical protein
MSLTQGWFGDVPPSSASMRSPWVRQRKWGPGEDFLVGRFFPC